MTRIVFINFKNIDKLIIKYRIVYIYFLMIYVAVREG